MSSVFFHMPKEASGAFSRGGFLFFSLTFNSLISQSELATFMQGRGVLEKHKSFALYRPMWYYIAQVISDFPLAVIQVIVFQLCVYFMAGLSLTAGQVCKIVVCVSIATLCTDLRTYIVLYVHGEFNIYQYVYEWLFPHVWFVCTQLFLGISSIQHYPYCLAYLFWLFDWVHAYASLVDVDLLDQPFGVFVQGYLFQRNARQLF